MKNSGGGGSVGGFRLQKLQTGCQILSGLSSCKREPYHWEAADAAVLVLYTEWLVQW